MIREALGRLWGGFGEALGGFGEAWGGFGSFGSVKINLGATFGRLWETLGDSEALGKLWESFRAFLLLAPSLPPLYIKKMKLPINRFSGPILI